MYAVLHPQRFTPLYNAALCTECAHNPDAAQYTGQRAMETGLFTDYPNLEYIGNNDALHCIWCGAQSTYFG